jgi:tRNA(Ile)-lysidine synthetase-like protein
MDINSYIVIFSLISKPQNVVPTLSPSPVDPADGPASDIFDFDFDLLCAKSGEISVRRRRAGDFITPAGMNGKKLIQDLFTDAKLPREKRDATPLIALGSEILCVLADGRFRRRTTNYAVAPATERILRITVSGAAF